MFVRVTLSTGDILKVECSRFDTIAEICEKVVQMANLGDIPRDRMFFFYKGKRLESGKALSDYDIQDGEGITVMMPQ